MSLSEKLELLVSMDPSKAVAGFQQIGDKAEAAGKSTESSMNKIGAAAMKVGIAGMGVGAMLTDLGSKEQASSQQMEASISAVGQSYDEFKGRIESTISSQEKFGHSAVDTQDAVSKLTMAYGDTGKALDQMQLVADLAAAKHISLADAANMVAKAHGGAGRIFKEFGVQVGLNADGTKNYDGALVQLSDKLKGQASAASDTFMGHLKALGTEVEDQVAKFGEKYGPAVMMASTALMAGGTIAQGVTAITGKLAAARAAEAAAAEGEAAASLGIGAALGGVGIALGLAVTAYEGYQHAESESINTSGVMKASTADLVKAFNEVPKSVFGMNSQLDYFSKIAETNIGTAQRLRDGLKAQGQDVSALDAVLRQAAEGQKQQTADTASGTDAANANADAVKAQEKAVKDLHDQIHAGLDPLFAMQKATEDNTKAQQDATKAAQDVWKATNDAAIAHRQYGAASQQAKDADAALVDAHTKLDDANMKVAQSALGVRDAASALSAGMKDGTVSVTDAYDKLQLWVGQGLLTEDQALAVAKSLRIVADNAKALDGANVLFSVAADTSQADNSIDALMSRLAGLGLAESGAMLAPGTAKPHAAGGFLDPGWNLLGEQGPELLNRESGQVLTAGQTRALGGGSHIAVTVQLAGGILLATNKRQMDALGESVSDGVRRALLKTSARNPAGVIGLL